MKSLESSAHALSSQNFEKQSAETPLNNSPTGLPRLTFHIRHREEADQRHEVLAGLCEKPRSIPPKFFYDSKGAHLFDCITQQPEYYLTRVERNIFFRYRKDIAAAIGRGSVLIEPGSGNSEKVELLLDSLRPQAYVPLDITESHLRDAAQRLVERYSWLCVHAVCGDYSSGLDLPAELPRTRRLVFFPGSTIGNFEPALAGRFLHLLRRACGENGALLIGVDLRKDAAVLNAAYNDKAGLTAAFNLNVLEHVNRIVDSNFDPTCFHHHAFFNEEHSRVEMHLESLMDQKVSVAGQVLDLAAGETIHTENSYKYSVEGFQNLAESAGFKACRTWCDDDNQFSVHLLNSA